MKKILIPTDFSSTAYNSTVYGLDFAKQIRAERVALFNAFQAPINVSPDPMVPSIESFDFDTLRKASSDSLHYFKHSVLTDSPCDFPVDEMSECCTLSADIDQIAKENEIDLIIMGITGTGSISEVFVGSNTIQVSKHTTVPLMIVPPSAIFSPVRNILFLTDYVNVKATTPSEEITKLLEATKANLIVLHVDQNYQEENTESENAEKEVLSSMFQNYKLEFFTANNSNFIDAVNDFIALKGIDLVIAVPKKHSFPDNILHHSYSKSMAFHTTVPLVMIKPR